MMDFNETPDCVFTEDEIGNATQILVPITIDGTPGFVTLMRFKELIAVLP